MKIKHIGVCQRCNADGMDLEKHGNSFLCATCLGDARNQEKDNALAKGREKLLEDFRTIITTPEGNT